MRNAFWKDIVRDIRKSVGRFGGMFAIVAIGVFMYTGLGSTGILMRNVGDRYYDQRGFFDIHVVSTFGLSERDMEALREVEGVESASGAYNLDVLIVHGTTQLNTKVHSLQIGETAYRQVNQPEIVSGRYPERFDEAVVEEAVLRILNLQIGNQIRLESGRTADVRNRLRTDTYRIVGTARSPLYFHRQRGASSIGNGQADAFLLLPEESFLQNVYSEAYLTVTGAEALYTYGDEYDALIDVVIDRIETVADIRGPQRKIEVTRRAWDNITEAEQEISRKEAQLSYQLLAAERDVQAGNRDVSSGRMELAQSEMELAGSYLLLDAQRLELENNLAEIESTLATLCGTETGLKDQRQSLQDSLAELRSSNEELLDSKRMALGMSSQLGAGLKALQDKLLEIDGLLAEVDYAIEQLELEKAALLDRYNASHDNEERKAILEELEIVSAQLLELYSQQEELRAKRRELEQQLDDLIEKESELQHQFHALRMSRRYWVQKMLQAEEGRHQLDLSLVTIQDLIATLEAQKAEVENGFTELEHMRLELDTASLSLLQNHRQLTASNKDLRDITASLPAQQELATQEMEAARQNIRENRKALANLSDPKWYILGRKTNAGFGGFSEESEQVSDIGSFLPLLFFLVAALVSLTTMTRLVEEQRTSMGTYKALGYSGRRILRKYLFYAIVPSGLGALTGGVLGLLFLPRIIIEGAFSAMYEIPHYKTEINLPYFLGGIALAVLSTAIPTWLTCRSELAEVPASLMRPKAPKVGGKTPLEYITFLWRRLSFLYKVTFRNIFRYKKRLFMTLVGVGGSTALLLTGLGMNDASNSIVDRQYVDLHHYDLSVTFVEDVTRSSLQSTRKALATSPLLAGNTLLREEMVELYNGHGGTEDATMLVLDPDNAASYITVRDRVSGTLLPLDTEGAALSELTARSLGLEAGSELIIRDADDKEFTVTVTAICEQYLGNTVYMSPETYEAAAGKALKHNTIYARQVAGVSNADISTLAETILDRNGVSSVMQMANQAQTYRDMLSAMKAVIILIIVIAALLAFVVLLNLTNINIAERMREIATIEVLGFRDKETSAYIYRENFVVTFAASLIGVCLGVPLHSFLCFSVEGDGMMLPREILPLSFLLAVVLTMVFAATVAQATRGKLRRIDMIEALKSAE